MGIFRTYLHSTPNPPMIQYSKSDIFNSTLAILQITKLMGDTEKVVLDIYNHSNSPKSVTLKTAKNSGNPCYA